MLRLRLQSHETGFPIGLFIANTKKSEGQPVFSKKKNSAQLVYVGLCWLVRLTLSFKGPLCGFILIFRRFPHFPFSAVSRASGGGGLFARRIFNRQVWCVAWTVRWSALRGITKYDEYIYQHLPTDARNRICRTSVRARTSSHVFCVLRMCAAETRAFQEESSLARGEERISSRTSSRRRCSLSVLWGSCWGWSSFLGVLLPPFGPNS